MARSSDLVGLIPASCSSGHGFAPPFLQTSITGCRVDRFLPQSFCSYKHFRYSLISQTVSYISHTATSQLLRPLTEPCLRYLRTRLLIRTSLKAKQIDHDSRFRKREFGE